MDGRVIKPEWLVDMAETYDPEVYTAKIWIDHMRYASYGSVRELKAEEDDKVVRLYAKISPSRSLLQMNQVWEEKLHFSIEPTENFAKTGKCYLTGLGMTDSPASLGTDEMRFSKTPGRDYTARYAGEQVPDLRELNDDHDLERFGQKLARFFTKNNKPKEDNETMDKQQFEALTTSITTMNAAIGDLAEKFETFAPEKKAAPAEEQTPAPTENTDIGQFAELSAGLKGLGDKFDSILERLEKENPGTKFGETTQPAADEGDLL
jgi:outer membrane murein-binding lipoprotein Lpp